MTVIHLSSDAADAVVTAGTGTKWKARTYPNSSATHCNKNGTGSTPLQFTDGGTGGVDGTAVSWYTEPLNAVTIAGAITVSLWNRENATSNNIAPTIRIERTDGAGNVLSTIVSEMTNHGAGEMPTTANGANDTINVTAGNVTDTALSTGDRLRITLWIDNASSQGGSGTTMAGHGETWVNGPNSAQGQSRLAFTETVCSGPFVEFVESARDNSNPKTATFLGCQAGDTLVVTGGGDQFGDSNDITAVTVSTTSGSTDSWSTVTEELGGDNDDWLGAYTTTVTADGDVTVQTSLTRTGGVVGTWKFTLYRVRNNGAIGNVSTSYTSSSTQTVSLAVSERSAVIFLSCDWDAGTTGSPTPDGFNTVEAATDSNYTENSHFWLDQPVGTRNYGTTGASGGSIRAFALEVLAVSTSDTDVDAEAPSYSVPAQGPTAQVKPGAESVPLSVSALDATVSTTVFVNVDADEVPLTVSAEGATTKVNGSPQTVALTVVPGVPVVGVKSNADGTSVAAEAQDADVSGASGVQAVAWSVVGADAASRVATGAESLPVAVAAQDATISTEAGALAFAEALPVALAGQDAAVRAAGSATDAPVAAEGLDGQAGLRLTAQGISAAVPAEDPQPQIKASAQAALFSMQTSSPSALTGTVVTTGSAPLVVGAQDATVTVQQSASAVAGVALFQARADSGFSLLGVLASVAPWVATGADGGNAGSLRPACAEWTVSAELISNFQPYGAMGFVEVSASAMTRLTPTTAEASGVPRSAPTMQPTTATAPTMGGT